MSSIEANFRKYDDTFSSQWINLADSRLQTKVLYANDEFFAGKENLIKLGRSQYFADKYTDRGKWMDGWETRRKRTPGFDYCILKLGTSGVIKGVDIDTLHFAGNNPESASVEACCYDDVVPLEKMEWKEILPQSAIGSSRQNLFSIDHSQRWTHVKLNIFPDGGVARFRVYGEVAIDWNTTENQLQDLVCILNGGNVIQCSDMFFSSVQNMLYPKACAGMWDGWETKRRRGPGNDWAIIKLGHPAKIQKIEVDTSFFKGNYPDRCSIEGIYSPTVLTADSSIDDLAWITLLSEKKLGPDQLHTYKTEIQPTDLINYIRVNIFPDGGIARLRVYGIPDVSL